MWRPKHEPSLASRTWTKIDWQPVPWYMRWRGRERRLVLVACWRFDFLIEDPQWEYRW